MRKSTFTGRVRIQRNRGTIPFLVLFVSLAALIMPMAYNVPTARAASSMAVPHIDSINPEKATTGEKVEITGSGFGPTRGTAYVQFGAYQALQYVSWSDTRIVVKVPNQVLSDTNAREIDVRVYRDGYSNAVELKVLPHGLGLAEGYTGNGFQEFLCIGNQNDCGALVEVYYFFPDNTYLFETFTMSTMSRRTINVNASINPYFENGSEVSVVVYSNVEVVVERPMYFIYNGYWTGGHDVVASPYLSKFWFFAEGYTGPGFDEYVCVLNYNDAPSNLTFHFQTAHDGEIDKTASVPAASRRTFRVNDLLGQGYECSLLLESDQYVVAERTVYFDYLGTGNHHWEGGHCVMGQPFVSKEYYFAEGTTRSGFEEWITIQNPFTDTITVNATYQLGEGQGEPVKRSYTIPPETRHTIYAYDVVGAEKDVSVKLISDSYFLAERPMYFSYTAGGAPWEGGHCVIGADILSTEWFFAEGYTGTGFHEWICLQNPGNEDADVFMVFLNPSSDSAIREVMVPARSRKTIFVNGGIGYNQELSCWLFVASGPPIMAERPMYFNYNGWDGGHDVVGYNLDPPLASSSSFKTAGLAQTKLLRDHAWEPAGLRRNP
ncbi:MAG: IPT/TIG domain-containing protein [Actinomycetota bacterium]